MTSTKASFRDLCVSIVLLLQFVIFIYEKSRGIAFCWNFFVTSPGLMRADTGGLVNEAYLSNPIISLKQ